METPRLLSRFGLLFAPRVYLNRGATFSARREAMTAFNDNDIRRRRPLMSISSSRARQLGLRLAITMLCAGGSAICTSRALGETATATSASEATADAAGLDEIIVTGSRQAGLKASDSPAPIQN
jgi:hypothetical protein